MKNGLSMQQKWMLKNGLLLIFSVCFLWLGELKAQDRPPIFPEDVDPTSLTPINFESQNVRNKSRSRGLDISYTRVNGATLNEEDQSLQEPLSQTDVLDNLSFKLKIPIIRAGKFKFLLGYRYQSEKYHFATIGPSFGEVFQRMDDLSLKNSGFGLIGSYRFNERISASARAQALYQGDYEGMVNFDNRYAVYQVQATIGVRKHEDIEWGVGLNFSHSFRRTIAIPFFLYNRTYNDHWGIEMTLPASVLLRYNFTPKSMLFFGPKYNSRSYSITIPSTSPDGNIYNLNHSEIRLSLDFEQQLRPWIWLNAELGYQYNFSTDFESPVDDAQSFKVEPSHTPFFKVGIFVSPPDKFLNQ